MKKGLLLLGAGAAALYVISQKKKSAPKEEPEAEPEEEPEESPEEEPEEEPRPAPEYIVEDGEIDIPDDELPSNYNDTWRLMQKALLNLGYNVPTNGLLNDKATQEALIKFKWDANTVGYYSTFVMKPTPSLSEEDWSEVWESVPDIVVLSLPIDLTVGPETAQTIAWARDKSPIKWQDLVHEARAGLKQHVQGGGDIPPSGPPKDEPYLPGSEDPKPQPKPQPGDEFEYPPNIDELLEDELWDGLMDAKTAGAKLAYIFRVSGPVPADFKMHLLAFANEHPDAYVPVVVSMLQPHKTFSLKVFSLQPEKKSYEVINASAKTAMYHAGRFAAEHIMDDEGYARLPAGKDDGKNEGQDDGPKSNLSTFFANMAEAVLKKYAKYFPEAYIFSHQDKMPGSLLMDIQAFAKANPDIYVGVENCQGMTTDRCGSGLYGLQVIDLKANKKLKTFNQIKGETALSLAEKYVSEGV